MEDLSLVDAGGGQGVARSPPYEAPKRSLILAVNCNLKTSIHYLLAGFIWIGFDGTPNEMADVAPYDVSALESAVNDSASAASNLWLSFLSFVTYLAIAVGGVTHKTLFLEKDIKLPLVSVDLPLSGFFVLAPFLLLIFHFYLFLHLAMLAK